MNALFVLTPVYGLAACVLAHILLTRAWPGMFKLTAAIYSFLTGAGTVLLLALAFGASAPAIDALGYGILWELTYLCLVYCYFFAFFNVGESARRVRLLIELVAAGERGLTLREILSAYNARMILEARLGRLLASGQIVERGGRYVIGTRLMLLVAKTMVLLKVIFLGAESEFGILMPGARNGRDDGR